MTAATTQARLQIGHDYLVGPLEEEFRYAGPTTNPAGLHKFVRWNGDRTLLVMTGIHDENLVTDGLNVASTRGYATMQWNPAQAKNLVNLLGEKSK